MTLLPVLRAVVCSLLAGVTVGRPGLVLCLTESDVLLPGAPGEFDLEVGASRRHPVTLEAGQFLHVELREKGPRIVLTLLDEKGSTLARREAPTDTITTLRLLAIAPASGAHALEVTIVGRRPSGPLRNPGGRAAPGGRERPRARGRR